MNSNGRARGLVRSKSDSISEELTGAAALSFRSLWHFPRRSRWAKLDSDSRPLPCQACYPPLIYQSVRDLDVLGRRGWSLPVPLG